MNFTEILRLLISNRPYRSQRGVPKARQTKGKSPLAMVVHNHPSGDPTPSRADIDMTRNVTTATKALGIVVHDHLVISRSGHASFKALGLM